MKHQFLTAIGGLAAFAALLAAPAANAQIVDVELITSDEDGSNYQYTFEPYTTLFASTAGGFAVGSTSPNFGGSTMATASSTEYLHFAEVELFQPFYLPSFITSARITLDFKGYAFAIGNAAAYVGYSITKFTSNGSVFIGSGSALSTDLAGLGGKAGSVSLSARQSFTLFGGESFKVDTISIAEAGYKQGAGGYFTYFSGPGYATAFMDPVISFTQGVPEPATWAMLIAGFGLVGTAGRRQRQRCA